HGVSIDFLLSKAFLRRIVRESNAKLDSERILRSLLSSPSISIDSSLFPWDSNSISSDRKTLEFHVFQRFLARIDGNYREESQVEYLFYQLFPLEINGIVRKKENFHLNLLLEAGGDWPSVYSVLKRLVEEKTRGNRGEIKELEGFQSFSELFLAFNQVKKGGE